MTHELPDSASTAPVELTSEYEAPRIQLVLTPEELEREVLYAGNVTSQ